MSFVAKDFELRSRRACNRVQTTLTETKSVYVLGSLVILVPLSFGLGADYSLAPRLLAPAMPRSNYLRITNASTFLKEIPS